MHLGIQQRVVITVFCALGALGQAAADVGVPVSNHDAGQALQGIRSYGPGAELQPRPALSGTQGAGPVETNRAATAVKISAASAIGSVNTFALSPDGATAVYLADHGTAGVFELYAVAVDGSGAMPAHLTNGLAFGAGNAGVTSFQVNADGTQVVFLADPGGVAEVYSAPIDGSLAPLKLNGAGQAPVLASGIAPDGVTVAYLGNDTQFGGGATELYKATIGSAGSGVQLSDASASVAGGVVAADFNADSSTMIYAADSASVGVLQWHSVPLAAGGTGSDVVLSAALGSISLGAITPDGATLVYAADENLAGVAELFSVPLSGGSSTQLNPSMAGFGVSSIRISGDSLRVAYLADQVTLDVVEVFGAQVGVADSGVRLNAPLAGTQSADVVTIGPDDATVVYESDENLAGTFDLMSAPIDTPNASSTLDAMTPPDSAGFFSGLGTPVIGGRVVYPVIGAATDLYSVPFEGTQGPVRINAPLAVGDTILGAYLPGSSARLMAYGAGAGGGITDELFAATIRSDLAPEQVNVTAAGGSLGVLGFQIDSSESYAVYLQDQESAGKPELYSAELDTDQDTVGNATDNCPFVSNTTQTAVTFGQTVSAADGDTFVWAAAADTRFVRGPLASVAALTTDLSGTLYEATSLVDFDAPGPGAGFFYLFAVDCAGRSYQTTLGSEPGRDAAGLP